MRPTDEAPSLARSDTPRPRRGYLDWMRGLAVLVMIEAHVIDSWTGGIDRSSPAFGRAMILGGFGAPLFLFLAGVAVSLSAGSKLRRLGDRTAASRAVARRGLEIFLLAFLFRIQAWVLGWSSPGTVLKVDILNIMGPSIVAAAIMWGLARSDRGSLIAFAVATLIMAFATPLVRTASSLAWLPDPVEAYIRPVRGLSNFVLFPWAGFVFAGALLGALIDRTHTTAQEARLNVGIGAAGALLAAGAYASSYLPTPYSRSDFWTSSPAFFVLRCGVMIAAVALAYAWQSRRHGEVRWSPMRQLGRTSLFIYWIHVEMVYGLISLRLHKSMTLPQAWLAFVAFAAFMLLCSVAKDRFVGWWRTRRRYSPKRSSIANA